MSRSKDKYGSTGPVEYPMGSGKFKVPVIRKRKKYYTHMMRFVGIGVPLLIIFLFIALTGQLTQARDISNTLSEQVDETYNPNFKARFPDIGAGVITNWYEQREPIISYSSDVEWPWEESAVDLLPEGVIDQTGVVQYRENVPIVGGVTFLGGYQSESYMSGSSDGISLTDPYEETLLYRMVLNGRVQNVSVTLLIPDLMDMEALPILVNSPSLMEPPEVQSVGISTEPREYGSRITPSPEMQSTIESWTRAWARGDRSQLKSITQDGSNRVYTGHGGFTRDIEPIEIVWSRSQEIDDTAYAVVRVRFNVVMSNSILTPEIDEETEEPIYIDGQFVLTQTMDLLIGKYDTSLPSIEAWGPPGTWLTLEPFQNGINPSDLPEGTSPTEEPEEDEEEDIDPTESPTPSPEPEEDNEPDEEEEE